MARGFRGSLASLITAAFAVACVDSPVRRVDSPPTPGSTTVRLTGQVTDRSGTPLSQALVALFSDTEELIEVITGDNGQFDIKVYRFADRYLGTVSRDGFEPGRFSLDSDALRADELRLAFHLYEIVRLQAGSSIELSVTSDDDLCDFRISHVDMGPCRRIRVVSPSGGRLSVSARVGAADEAAGHAVMTQFAFPPYETSAPIEVGAGWETVVEIVKIGHGDLTRFTLQTKLTP